MATRYPNRDYERRYWRDRVVGIVSQADLARHAGAFPGHGERQAFADVMCAVSEPTPAPYR